MSWTGFGGGGKGMGSRAQAIHNIRPTMLRFLFPRAFWHQYSSGYDSMHTKAIWCIMQKRLCLDIVCSVEEPDVMRKR